MNEIYVDKNSEVASYFHSIIMITKKKVWFLFLFRVGHTEDWNITCNYISKSSAQSNILIWKHATIVIRIKDDRILQQWIFKVRLLKRLFSTFFPHEKGNQSKNYLAFDRVSHNLDIRFFVFIWKIVCDFVEFVACHITAVIISYARQSLLILSLSLLGIPFHLITYSIVHSIVITIEIETFKNVFPFFPIHLLAIDFNRCFHLLTSPFLLHS